MKESNYRWFNASKVVYSLALVCLLNIDDGIASDCTSNYSYWYTSNCAAQCTACGLYHNQYSHCIACNSGYVVDVLYVDGTGHCVAEGTATDPLSSS